MSDWKQSLDRWLTSEPPDNYTPWVEKVWDFISEDVISPEVYDHKQSTFEKWENYLYEKGYEPRQAAILIAKTYTHFHILEMLRKLPPDSILLTHYLPKW